MPYDQRGRCVVPDVETLVHEEKNNLLTKQILLDFPILMHVTTFFYLFYEVEECNDVAIKAKTSGWQFLQGWSRAYL